MAFLDDNQSIVHVLVEIPNELKLMHVVEFEKRNARKDILKGYAFRDKSVQTYKNKRSNKISVQLDFEEKLLLRSIRPDYQEKGKRVFSNIFDSHFPHTFDIINKIVNEWVLSSQSPAFKRDINLNVVMSCNTDLILKIDLNNDHLLFKPTIVNEPLTRTQYEGITISNQNNLIARLSTTEFRQFHMTLCHAMTQFKNGSLQLFQIAHSIYRASHDEKQKNQGVRR